MFGKVTGVTGLICFSLFMMVSCRGVYQPAEPDLEPTPAVTKTQPVVAVEPTRLSAPATALVPTSMAPVPSASTTAATTRVSPPGLQLPRPANQLDEREYTWSQLLGRDSIPPIYESEVEFVEAQNAPYDDDELVIGVAINGEAKAYAIGPLNAREMVNDAVGGVPILVTW